MVVTKLLSELGGTPLEDRTDKSAISEDHTETWQAMLNSSMKGLAQTPLTSLKNGGWTNEGLMCADIFTSASGVKSTVNTTNTTAFYDSGNNKYILGMGTDEASGDTTSDPDTFTNPNNAFDGDDATFAEEIRSVVVSAGVPSQVRLGKTFSAKLIKYVKIKADHINTATTISSQEYNKIILQTFDGAIWTDHTILVNNTFANGGTSSIDTLIKIDTNIQGLRIEFNLDFENSGGSNVTQTCKLYTLEYSTQFASSSIVDIDANTLTLDGNELTSSTFSDLDLPTNTSLEVEGGDGTNSSTPVVLDSKGFSGAFALSSNLTSGTLNYIFTLKSTDTLVTPSLSSYGGNIN